MSTTVGEIRARLILDSSNFNSNLNNAHSNTRKTLGDIQRFSALAGGAIAGVMAASVKSAADFEQGLANVKAVSGATATEMQQMKKLALEMSKATKYSATEATKGIEELIKAGVSVADIMDGGLKSALDLAVAGELDLASSAEIASTALNAFKEDNLKVADAANILSGASNASATDVGELKYGLSMVSAVAAGAGMSFEDTATALAVFAQNGLKSSDAGTSLKTMLMRLIPTTNKAFEEFDRLGLMTFDLDKAITMLGENGVKVANNDIGTVEKAMRKLAAELSHTKEGSAKANSEYTKLAMQTGVLSSKFYDSEGNLKNLNDIAGILKESMSDLSNAQRTQAMNTMFGSDAIRASTILFKEGAEGVDTMNIAINKVTAAEVAAVKLDTLKGAVVSLKASLETAGIQIGSEFLPALTNIAKKGTDMVNMFATVDPALISTTLKMAGTSAAILFVASTVAKLALSMKTLMVSMGPAGWIIGGLSIIGGLLVGVADGYDEVNKVSLDTVNSMAEQHTSLSNNIDKYDELRAKCALSTDELARFVDINSEISKTTDTDIIAKLTEEQDKLRKKSGLSNGELENLLALNGEILEVVPEATDTLSEQGNVLLDNTKKAKKYNAEQLELIRIELEAQKTKAEANINKNLVEEKRIKEDINSISKKRTKIEAQIGEEQVYINEQTELLNKAKREGNEQGQLFHQNEIGLHEVEIQLLKEQNSKLANKTLEKSKSLEEVRKEIKALAEVKNKMLDIELKQVGITAKRGEELKVIDKEIGKLEEKKKKLQEQTPINERNTEEYLKSKEAIQKQIDNLNVTKDKVEEILLEAANLNSELGKEVNKTVNVSTNSTADFKRADRETYHTGGIVGKTAINSLPKLHTGGLPFQVADTPMHHETDVRLLRNEMVLTEAQQGNLMKMIDAGRSNQLSHSPQKVEKNLKYEVTIHSPIQHSLYEEHRKVKQMASLALQEL